MRPWKLRAVSLGRVSLDRLALDSTSTYWVDFGTRYPASIRGWIPS